MKAGDYALGSPQSRAAARAMLEARRSDKLRFQAVSILDGSMVNLDGLAEAIRGARMRNQAGFTDKAIRRTGMEFISPRNSTSLFNTQGSTTLVSKSVSREYPVACRHAASMPEEDCKLVW